MPATRNSCGHCGLTLPTPSGLRRHIAHSRACRMHWEAQLARPVTVRAASSLFQAGQGPPVEHDQGLMDELHHYDGDENSPQHQHEDAPEELEDSEPITQYAHVFNEKPVAETLGMGETSFDRMKASQEVAGGGDYTPFIDKEEWELADWLINNVNQGATDTFLKLGITRERTRPNYKNKNAFLKIVDQLPTGPEWSCELIRAHEDADGPAADEAGETDETEELELWMRNPIACVQELIGNPAFKEDIAYAPEKVYADIEGRSRRYDEMWTSDWWWEMQHRLPEGATIAPVILASDKTQLSRFKGDKNAWPVYLSIGNISKHIRRQPSRHASESILIGYLPASKLELVDSENSSVAGQRLFHYCMKKLLEPLVAAGKNGVNMVCADGLVRRVFPIVAAYIGDHPEQCLVACCTQNHCPKCLVRADERGVNRQFPPRNQTDTIHTLHAQASGRYPPEFIAEGLHPIFSPFWADLPHCDIFLAITADILHQLHQGVFKDHLKKWCCSLAGKKDLDARFQAIPTHSGQRHFKDGISKIKQWTGGEHKQLQHVFIGALVGATPPEVIKAARHLVDFIYLAQYQSHTDDTLHALQAALDEFHAQKEVFIYHECRGHFNFPKLHSLIHYVDTIRLLGSLDGLNSEHSERLHIDYAKKAYAASNQKDYTIQMTQWLQRQEAFIRFKSFLTWRGLSMPTLPHTTDASPRVRFHISSRPHFVQKPVQYLEEYHAATGFIDALQTFLNTLPLHSRRFHQPNRHDRFDCFKMVTLHLLPCVHMTSTDHARVHAYPLRSNGPRKPPTQARFDTVLVREDVDLERRGGFHGLRVAQVCVLFKLPPHLGDYPIPLAYIHWFKPLRQFDNTVGMFNFGRSTRQHHAHAAIIPVDRLIQVCHLIPKYPSGPVHPRWIQGHALEDATSFYLNRYIDYRLFQRYRDHFSET